MIRALFAATAFLIALPFASALELKLPLPEQETLPNGLKVVWFLSDSIPVVDISLMVNSGYRDDPQGKSGTVGLLAETLDRGAGGMTAGQLAGAIEMLGASRYVSASDDTISVGVHGLAPDAPALLDVLSKLVIHPEFQSKEVEREHARLLDRWEHIGDYGETLAGLAYNRSIAAGTSYVRGSLASSREFRNVKRDDVIAFHRTHFTPANSVLMVVGRVEKEKFRARLVDLFGAWAGKLPARDWRKGVDPRMGKPKAGEVILVNRPGLTQAQVRIGFPAPLIQSPHRHALAVANALLGEYFNSRLNSLIRDKLGLTYGIGSGFTFDREFATLTITSATRNEQAGQLIQRTVDVLRALKAKPIPEEEVKTAKEYLVGGFPLSVSTLHSVASRWLGGYVFGLGEGYLNEFVSKVSAVTAADVNRAVAEDFKLDAITIVVAGDASKLEPALKAAKIGKIRRVSISELK